jgi:hypothetical protein
VNRTHGRSGTLWEGRFRSCLVGEEVYLFACSPYIELHPVRANMVADPAGYRWSSYRVNALGEVNPMVVPHATYEALGSTPAARQELIGSCSSGIRTRAGLRKSAAPTPAGPYQKVQRYAKRRGSPCHRVEVPRLLARLDFRRYDGETPAAFRQSAHRERPMFAQGESGTGPWTAPYGSIPDSILSVFQS